MEKKDITPGPWATDESENNSALIDQYNKVLALFYSKENASLSAEAGTVFHESGLTPRELMTHLTLIINACDKSVNQDDLIDLINKINLAKIAITRNQVKP